MKKQRWGESEKRKEEDREEKESEERRCRCAKEEVEEEIAKHCVFPMFWGSGGSNKSRLAKAAGVEPSRQMRNVKLHAVVVRSTFGSKNAQSTSRPEHFWKLRCGTSARCCGHGARLDVKMVKNDSRSL